ncbi:TfoX/Sxy family protein [Pseudomonas sp. Hp2]|uniref:TfoX/Sxy family protein n=1 Tax=Pseudomonas sp. Hp2 TaxID=701189 RepID=UPI00112D2317|nr:TfoX/Sxy family protein [Pseudomonas sp. Hp2]
MTEPLRNIGPKSAAWLRQVGVRTQEDLAAAGAVGAFLRVRRAGFKPSLNLLYSLEGALVGCHWQQVPPPRRQQLQAELEQAIAEQPAPRGRPVGGHVTTTRHDADDSEGDMPASLDMEHDEAAD